MSDIECRHLDKEGICQGKYKGFGCIGDKCQDPTRGPKENKGYCSKHKKFNCECEG